MTRKIDLSVMVVGFFPGELVWQQIAEIGRVLSHAELHFELLAVCDARVAADMGIPKTVGAYREQLRRVRIDRAAGPSEMVTAGLARAKGNAVMAIAAGDQFLPEEIPILLERLGRADMVCGRRRRGRLLRIGRRIAQMPRRLLLGVDARDPDCLFWAARREAVEAVSLPRGMHRYLPTLVAARGFRVTEVYVADRPASRARLLRPERPSPGDLLAAWWYRRRWLPYTAEEGWRLSDARGTLPTRDAGTGAKHRFPSQQSDSAAEAPAENSAPQKRSAA